MSHLENLSESFRPEERKRGEDLAKKDLVMISSSSDTGVKAFVKANGNCRVTLAAQDVGSSEIFADCTCSNGKKGHLCKHVWAVLMKLEEKGLDFLEDKQMVESQGQATINSGEISASQKRLDEAKERQSEFRKQAYEKQKARAKEMKLERKSESKTRSQKKKEPAFRYPDPVEEAREYFEKNGCPLPHPIEMEDLAAAKKTLSRVFHPDKGGSHDEILELNENFEIVRDYLNS